MKMCWLEKQREKWNDVYGKEREKYYNRNGWDIVAVDTMTKKAT